MGAGEKMSPWHLITFGQLILSLTKKPCGWPECGLGERDGGEEETEGAEVLRVLGRPQVSSAVRQQVNAGLGTGRCRVFL